MCLLRKIEKDEPLDQEAAPPSYIEGASRLAITISTRKQASRCHHIWLITPCVPLHEVEWNAT